MRFGNFDELGIFDVCHMPEEKTSSAEAEACVLAVLVISACSGDFG